ncbi:Gfo/Idh/MocA family protein [Romboutsia sp.]|uniref:Gfo/Idh/MocA family protein n=1 Tax=Romboutsia sp. TaxID=1965302 RepID=UPI003F323E36
MKKVSIAVIGAGCRGMYAYAPYLLENPNLGNIVAIAEPIEEKRNLFKEKYNIEEDYVFKDWKDLLKEDKLADGIIIANNDDDHFMPAKIALEKGYHVLLEKPMSNKIEEIIELEKLAKKYNKNIFMICHVLRYTPFFTEIKKIIDSKELGELVSIQHNENIGYWHFAHSYTRGNWRNSNETSPLILAKSCHDMDLLLWLTNKKCLNVASFGSLTVMKSEKFKEGMSDNCVNCKIEKDCPYSAKKIYLQDNKISASLNAVHTNPTKENLANAIINGPYGRCVYKCDNNVVDHMVSILEFEGGITATFNLSAFTKECTRTIKLMFSHGEVGGNHINNIIDVYKFGENHHKIIKPKQEVNGHGGGDYGIIKDFLSLIADDKGDLKTSAIQSIQSHIMAFALEDSRLNYKVVNIKAFVESYNI